MKINFDVYLYICDYVYKNIDDDYKIYLWNDQS